MAEQAVEFWGDVRGLPTNPSHGEMVGVRLTRWEGTEWCRWCASCRQWYTYTPTASETADACPQCGRLYNAAAGKGTP